MKNKMQILLEDIQTGLKKCSDLFYEIRCDWSDPRSECREGRDILEQLNKKIESFIEQCDICGDHHEPSEIPRECETGNGV